MKSFLIKRIQSFKYAFAGLKLFFSEVNFRIHLLAFVIVLILAFYFDLSRVEWFFVLSASFIVIICEAINTVIEKAMDRITEAYDKKIGQIKDMSAAFVLIAAIYAVIVACIVFIPKIIQLFV